VKKTLHVQYFAILREQAGTSRETLTTEAPDAAALYCEVAARHGFSLDVVQIRVAIHNEYQPLETPLAEGMLLTFIPPVAGG
jgi:molybdopterin converting factor small subunit